MQTAGSNTTVERKPNAKFVSKRSRKGAGCVYRPKFKGKDEKIRLGEWRIKFVWKDDVGIKHVFDKRAEGSGINKTVAQEQLKKRMAEVKNNRLLADVEELTYQNLRAGLIGSYEDKGHRSLLTKKDGTRYISSLNHLDNFFGECKAVEIRSPQIAAFKKARMASGVGNASINRSLGLLRRMFSIAVRHDQFPKDRMPFFELLEEPEPRIGLRWPLVRRGIRVEGMGFRARLPCCEWRHGQVRWWGKRNIGIPDFGTNMVNYAP